MIKRPWLQKALTLLAGPTVAFAFLDFVRPLLSFNSHRGADALAVGSAICFRFGFVAIYTGTVSAPRGRGRSLYTMAVRKDDDRLAFWMGVGLYLCVGAALLFVGGQRPSSTAADSAVVDPQRPVVKDRLGRDPTVQSVR